MSFFERAINLLPDLKLHRFLENGLTGKISQKTDRKTCGRDTEEVIGELNLMLKGWANYFQLGVV